jgi:DNA polymerase
MSKEIIGELAELARQIEDQLKFYREIGVTDIGGAGVKAEVAPAATPEAGSLPRAADDSGQLNYSMTPVSSEPAAAEHLPVPGAGAEQSSLFVELAVRPAYRSTPLAGPILTSSDTSLEAIRQEIGDCVRCKLHVARNNIVFGEGNPEAKLVFVGEGPGADEDATGRPFVGRAGQLLNKIIEAIGLRREDVYICNVVKCRPPGNRTPERDEVATCEPFLFRQLAFIRPKVIVVLGLPAFQCLLKSKESMSRSRGEWREWNGIKVMPTFHPAYLLRSPEKKRETWEDMKKVRDYLASQTD